MRLLILILLAFPVFAAEIHPDGSITLTKEERAALAAGIRELESANAQLYEIAVQQDKALQTCKPTPNT